MKLEWFHVSRELEQKKLSISLYWNDFSALSREVRLKIKIKWDKQN